MKSARSGLIFVIALSFFVMILSSCGLITVDEQKVSPVTTSKGVLGTSSGEDPRGAENEEKLPLVPSAQKSTTTTPVVVTPKKEYHQLETDEYFYDVVYDDTVNVGSNDFYSNPQFVRTDKASGEKVVLFADLEKITKPTHKRDGYSVFAFSKEKNTLYLASFIGETEGVATVTWKFDLTTKKLEPLKFKPDTNVKITAES